MYPAKHACLHAWNGGDLLNGIASVLGHALKLRTGGPDALYWHGHACLGGRARVVSARADRAVVGWAVGAVAAVRHLVL